MSALDKLRTFFSDSTESKESDSAFSAKNILQSENPVSDILTELKNTFKEKLKSILSSVGIKLDALKKEVLSIHENQESTESKKEEKEKSTENDAEKKNSNKVKLSKSAEATWNNESFQKAMKDMCDRLKIDPEHLKLVMNKESGINPQAVNPTTKATGLIQFMPKTAQALGTSVSSLRQMSAVEQLKYVEKFYQPYKGKLTTAGSLYLATFYPLAMSKWDNFILGSEKSAQYAKKVARQNPGIAKFSDTKAGITKSAFEKYVYA